MNEVDDNECFVKLIQYMGDDLSIVNAARVSMNKRSSEMRSKDERLIKYLFEHEHTSPFRHQYLTFHIKAPLFVLRQWQKHQVGCSFNEQSFRYVSPQKKVWKPSEWRCKPVDTIKQGSSVPVPDIIAQEVNKLYEDNVEAIIKTYDKLLELGICKEQARMILPLSTITEVWWTASLQATLHFLDLRLEKTAQKEIQFYAQKVAQITKSKYPIAFKVWQERNALCGY
ncbi:MAG TPA: FAD-dependent thymidylate synthase [Balneola sp.]|nr:FAD-dependent thymidylate synthase [Balneola sp.]|tara:strand:- start:713 stop:1393 length:681 start_codon:yes stop_codon:yes gene_type:complete